MTRKARAEQKKRRWLRAGEDARRPLDPVGRDSFKRLVDTFLEAGYSGKELLAVCESAVLKAPRLNKPHTGETKPEFHDTSDVLRLWASDPECVDDEGEPLALPVLGPAPSVESLLKRVRPNMPLEEALGLFFRTHALQKVGRKLIPRKEADQSLIHAPGSEDQSTHHILVVDQLSRTFEFNRKRGSHEPGWPQRVAECAQFPVKELPALLGKVDKAATNFLKVWNDTMARMARRADSSTPRTRAAINLFLSIGPTSRVRPKKKRGASKPG